MKLVGDSLLTSSEVGQLLQVNASSVKKWVDEGLLEAFRTPGGHRRIRAVDLMSFLSRHGMPVPNDLQDVGRKRVLLLDDGGLAALARGLKRHNDRVDVLSASNAIDALVMVGSFQPQFLILEASGSDVDSLEIVRRLKKRAETKDVAVVLVASSWTPAAERKAIEAGATKCLAKPVETQALMALVIPANEGHRLPS